jgi:hypothetical protein
VATGAVTEAILLFADVLLLPALTTGSIKKEKIRQTKDNGK